MQRTFLSTVLLALLLTGCAAPVQVITPPAEPLGHYDQFMVLTMKNDVIGKINQSVISRIMSEAVTRISGLNHFRTVIVDENMFVDQKLLNSGAVIRRSAFTGDSANVAVMQVTLTSYDEGSALVRFFLAPFAGMGKVGCDIRIVSAGTGNELVRARTVSSIGGITPGAEGVITPIAKALTNVVERYFVLQKKK
jgi:hypothetical protein